MSVSAGMMYAVTKAAIGNRPVVTDEGIALIVAHALAETGFGQGWSANVPGARNSNNVGAITAGPNWKGARFTHIDCRPDVDHHQIIRYKTDFRSYPTLLAGVQDLVRWYDTHGMGPELETISHGYADAFALELYRNRYYTGTVHTAPASEIEGYIKEHPSVGPSQAERILVGLANVQAYATRLQNCRLWYLRQLAKIPDAAWNYYETGSPDHPRIWSIYQLDLSQLLVDADADARAERDALATDDGI